MKLIFKKLKKYGLRGSKQILLKLLKTALVEISYGARFQDKLALLVRWLLMPFYLMIHGKYPNADFYSFNVMLKTPYGGLFYCKRGTGDVYAITSDDTPLDSGYNWLNSFPLDEFYKEGIFLDIGANIGKYTILMAKMNKKGKVIAIEPNPDVYERLVNNIKLNHLKNVIPLRIAADSQNRRLHLYVDPVCHGFSRLNQSVLDDNQTIFSVEVETKRVDDILEELKLEGKVTFAKIDVEGWEAEVLKGMARILRTYKPTIVFEAWNEAYLRKVEEVLVEFGYKVQALSEYNYLALPG